MIVNGRGSLGIYKWEVICEIMDVHKTLNMVHIIEKFKKPFCMKVMLPAL